MQHSDETGINRQSLRRISEPQFTSMQSISTEVEHVVNEESSFEGTIDITEEPEAAQKIVKINQKLKHSKCISKYDKRKLQNRKSALKCRLKKQQLIEKLSDEVSTLNKEKEALKIQIAELNATVSQVQAQNQKLISSMRQNQQPSSPKPQSASENETQGSVYFRNSSQYQTQSENLPYQSLQGVQMIRPMMTISRQTGQDLLMPVPVRPQASGQQILSYTPLGYQQTSTLPQAVVQNLYLAQQQMRNGHQSV